MSDEAPKSGLTPHPLIRGLAAGLISGQNVEEAGNVAKPGPVDDAVRKAADQFASDSRPKVAAFSGYLGGTVKDHEKEWRVLYLDASALTCVLVCDDDIVLHERAQDRYAAFNYLDVIWVKTNAPVRQGSSEEPAEAWFLVGSFTSAGDLYTSLTAGGTLAADSGILCAPSTSCCMRHSR
jgi:hypothetical protein